MKYYLNENVRFRKEKEHILICDLSTFENYSFPLKFYNDFIMLKKGKIIIEKDDFFQDLKYLKLISSKKNNKISCKIDVFSKLKYEESEFFNYSKK